MDLLYSDVTSVGGAKTAFVLLDEASSYTWVYPLAKKSHAASVIDQWLQVVERETGRKVVKLIADLGGEFVNTKKPWEMNSTFSDIVKNRGILVYPAAAGRQEQNGKVERTIQDLSRIARALILGCGLPDNFWAEALDTANLLKRIWPTVSNPGFLSPFEMFHGTSVPRYAYRRFKRYGCAATIPLDKSTRTKWGPHAETGILVGYTPNYRNYRVFLPRRAAVVDWPDPRFNEELLPAINLFASDRVNQTRLQVSKKYTGAQRYRDFWYASPDEKPLNFDISNAPALDQTIDIRRLNLKGAVSGALGPQIPPPSSIFENHPDPRSSISTAGEADSRTLTVPTTTAQESPPLLTETTQSVMKEPSEVSTSTVSADSKTSSIDVSSSSIPLRRSSRSRLPSKRVQEAKASLALELDTLLSGGVGDGEDIDRMRRSQRKEFLMTTYTEASLKEPDTFEEAMNCPQWAEAALSEAAQLWDLGVIEEVEYDPKEHRRVITSKWVWKLKRGADGSIAKWKARITARGFQPALPDFDVFATVARLESFRLLMTIAILFGKHIATDDVKGAFLKASVPDDMPIYVEPPPGLQSRSRNGRRVIWNTRL
ncbi:MAG: reverse transcriptase domain-containing protein [Bacteroidota bacterium]